MKKLIFILLLVSLLPFAIGEFEKSKKLPVFNLDIPQKISSNSIQSMNEGLRVIIILENPEQIWKNEIKSYSNSEINELKQVMNFYTKSQIKDVKSDIKSLNGFSAVVTPSELSQLKSNSLVKEIIVDKPVKISMTQARDVMDVNEVWNLKTNGINLTGHGQSVCVVDTGVDYTHSDLGGCSISKTSNGTIESYSRSSPNYPANYPNDYLNVWTITKSGYERISVHFSDFITEDGIDFVYLYDGEDNFVASYSGDLGSFWSASVIGDTVKVELYTDSDTTERGFNINATMEVASEEYDWSSCNKVIAGYDFVNIDGDPIDDQGHGTHVAGIVAAKGTNYGVAPDARIIAVKTMDATGAGWTSDIVSGIEYCNSIADEYNISVISISLGSNEHFLDYCDSELYYYLYSPIINHSFDAGISVVAATGNELNYTGIGAPACINKAIPVGATYDSAFGDQSYSYGDLSCSETTALDLIACFTNRNSLLKLLAPGSLITSTQLGGGSVSMGGTSMATPQVSGSIAIFNQYLEANLITMTPHEIEDHFSVNGESIYDSETGLNFSRINLYDSVMALDTTPTIIVNMTANVIMNNTLINHSINLFNQSLFMNDDVSLKFEYSETNLVKINGSCTYSGSGSSFEYLEYPSGNNQDFWYNFSVNGSPIILCNVTFYDFSNTANVYKYFYFDNQSPEIISNLNQTTLFPYDLFIININASENLSGISDIYLEDIQLNKSNNYSMNYTIVLSPISLGFTTHGFSNLTMNISDNLGNAKSINQSFFMNTSIVLNHSGQNINLNKNTYSNDSKLNLSINSNRVVGNLSLQINGSENSISSNINDTVLCSMCSTYNLTMTLSDGFYNITIYAEDFSADYYSFDYVIDTTKPEIESLVSDKNKTLSNITFNVAINESNPILYNLTCNTSSGKISYQTDNQLTSIWDHTFNLTLNHNENISYCELYVMDILNQTTKLFKNFSISIDKKSPYINHVSSNVTLAKLDLPILFSMNISEQNQILNILINNVSVLNSSDFSEVGNNKFYQFVSTLENLNVTSEGIISLPIVFIDELGNINQTSISILVDNRKPNLVLQSSNLTNTYNPKIEFLYLDNESNGSCIISNSINNLQRNEIENNSLVSVNFNINGNNQMAITCNDMAQNNNSIVYVFSVDLDAPTTSINFNSTGYLGSYWFNSPVEISLNSSNDFDYIQWKNTSWLNYSTPIIINYSISGNYIYFTSYDLAGNKDLDRQHFFGFDNVNPSIDEIKLTSSIVSGNSDMEIQVNISDNNEVYSAWVSLNGTNRTLSKVSNFYSATITSPSIDGIYSVDVYAVDLAGNQVMQNKQLIVNSTLPTINVNKPDGYIISNDATILVTTNSNHSWYAINNTLVNFSFNAQIQISSLYLNLSSSKEINLSIYANNSIQLTNQNYSYILDVQNPNFTANIVQSQKINGTLNLTVNATDDNVVSFVLFSIDNQLFNDSVSPYSLRYPTSILDDGLINMTVAVYDLVGNSFSQNIAINITNQVQLTLNTSGDANSSLAKIASFENTPVENLLDSINGLNSTNVKIKILSQLPNAVDSTQLSDIIGKINISAQTSSVSRIIVKVPKIQLDLLNLTLPYSNLAFYADHGSGVVGPLNSSYIDTIVSNGIELVRFWTQTDNYSIFVWGKQAEYCGDSIVQSGEACDDGNSLSGDGCSSSCQVEVSPSSSSSGGGGGGGSLLTKPKVNETLSINESRELNDSSKSSDNPIVLEEDSADVLNNLTNTKPETIFDIDNINNTVPDIDFDKGNIFNKSNFGLLIALIIILISAVFGYIKFNRKNK